MDRASSLWPRPAAAPDDITDWMQAPLVADTTYRAEARSVVVLIAGLEPRRPAGMDAALAPV